MLFGKMELFLKTGKFKSWKGERVSNFLLQPFRVNGKTIIGLIGSTPSEITQKKAIEEIQIWSGNTTLNRNAKEAKIFFQGIQNKIFQNGIEVKTHDVKIEEG